MITVLDVLENFFGQTPSAASVNRLDAAALDQLGDAVLASSEALVDEQSPPGTYYLGGDLGAFWHDGLFDSQLFLALLYCPRILVHDPLADFFFTRVEDAPRTRGIRSATSAMTVEGGPQIWGLHNTARALGGDVNAVRARLGYIVETLVSLAPLIKAGIVIPRAQWPTILARKTALETSLRRDVASADMQAAARGDWSAPEDQLAVWDHLRGLTITPGDGVDPRDADWITQHEFLYLAKTLAIADQAGAVYSPTKLADLNLLKAKAKQVEGALRTSGTDLSLLKTVAEVAVPDLRLDAKSVVAIHASEADFADWRRTLTRIARESRSESSNELRERVEDELLPVRDRVVKATSRSLAIRAALKEQSATTLLTGGVAVGATALSATGSPPIALGTSLTSGVLSWLWKAYRPPGLGGSEAILASLIRSSRTH